MRVLGLILMVSALVACGDDEAGDDDDDVVTIDAATTTPDAPAGGADAAAVDGAAVDAAAVDGAATDGGGGAFATFTGVTVFGDCMPIVPPDPMSVSFTVQFDNTAGASIAKIIVDDVELTWDDGRGTVETQTINVAPMVTTIPAGESEPVTFNKTTAIGASADDCDFCGGTLKVTLSLIIDGADPQVFTSDAVDVACSR